jgi:hypothetical protein
MTMHELSDCPSPRPATQNRPGAVAAMAARTLTLTAAGMAALLLAVLAPARPAHARQDATTYSARQRVLNVGVLLLDSTMDANGDGLISDAERAIGPENSAPYIFHIAGARSDLKPLDWEFVNPLAPKTVTTDVKARWDVRDPRSPYQAGQAVTKNMAAYWEVFLSRASPEDLLQFDLLYITGHRDVRFSAPEREKLRKLVDAGGVVWIEDSAGLRVRADGPFFLNELQFRGTGGGGNGGPQINAPNHPLLNSPYRLSVPEIANLGGQKLRQLPSERLYPRRVEQSRGAH